MAALTPGAIAKLAIAIAGGAGVTIAPTSMAMTFSTSTPAVTAGATIAPTSLATTFGTRTQAVTGGATVSPTSLATTFGIGAPAATGGATASPTSLATTFGVGSPAATGGATATPTSATMTWQTSTPGVTGSVALYSDSTLAYNGNTDYQGVPAVQIIPTPVPITFSTGSPSATGAAVVAPTSVSITWQTSLPTVTAGVTVSPTSLAQTWQTSLPTVTTIGGITLNPTYASMSWQTGNPAFGAGPTPGTYGALTMPYNGPSSYNGAAGAIAAANAGLTMTFSTGSATVTGAAAIAPTATSMTFQAATPTVVSGAQINPIALSMGWRTANPSAQSSRSLAAEQPWVNPRRNSLDGVLAEPLNAIFDDLEQFLLRPVFPQGIIVGNGAATRGAPPTVAVTVAADAIAPNAPLGLTVIGAVQAIALRWEANVESDLAGYYVEVDTNASFTGAVRRTSGGNTSVVSGLTFGTTYYARVRAFDLSGNLSGWSSTQSGSPAQITGPDIAANTIVANMIVAGSITGDRIAGNTIAAGNLQAVTIDAGGIKVGGVVAGTVSANAIAANMIQAGAITADKIQANVIDASKITVGGLTTATLADLSVLETKIGSLAISNRTIQSGAINARNIQAQSITASEIAADTITANQIAANTITADEMSSVYLTVGKVIQSVGFSDGVSGWSINGNGDAQFNNVSIRGALYAGTATGNYVAIAASDQDTVRFYTGAGDWAAINALGDRLQLQSPYGQGGNSYIELLSSNAASGLSTVIVNASTLQAYGNIIASGSFQTNNNMVAQTAGQFGVVQGYGGGAGSIQMTSANRITFGWNGTQVEAYIDGSGPYKFKSV